MDPGSSLGDATPIQETATPNKETPVFTSPTTSQAEKYQNLGRQLYSNVLQVNTGTPVSTSPTTSQAAKCRNRAEPGHRPPLMKLDSNILASEVNTGTRMAEKPVMEKRQGVIKQCIISHQEKFTRFMSKFEIVGKMKEQRLLTKREEKLFTSGDQVDIELLIEILEHKSDDAFTRFYYALKDEESHLGHNQLAELIEDVM